MYIGIIGSGAWGTALAINLTKFSNTQHKVLMFAHEQELSEEINQKQTNSKYFAAFKLNSNIKASSNINDLLACDILLLTTPVPFIKPVLTNLIGKDIPPIIICAKGINKEGQIVSNVVTDTLGDKVTLLSLSGPSFATEIADGMLCALSLASNNFDYSNQIIQDLSFKNIRLYPSDDLIGSQVGGALKNVIAIAAGITKGLNLGHNALASLITRGNYELYLLTTSMGGKSSTAYGLSGMGDLILTATSTESRNFSLGLAIAKQKKFSHDITPGKSGIAEGYYTADSINTLANKYNIDLPICSAVYQVLYQNKDLNVVINSLLSREIEREFNTEI